MYAAGFCPMLTVALAARCVPCVLYGPKHSRSDPETFALWKALCRPYVSPVFFIVLSRQESYVSHVILPGIGPTFPLPHLLRSVKLASAV